MSKSSLNHISAMQCSHVRKQQSALLVNGSLAAKFRLLDAPPGLRRREEPELFGRSRIFLSDSGCPIGSFFTSHC